MFSHPSLCAIALAVLSASSLRAELTAEQQKIALEADTTDKSLAKVVESARAAGAAFPCEVSTEETMPCGFGACAGCVVPVAAPVTPETPDGYRYAKSCVEGPVFPVEAIRWDLIRSTH